LSVGLQWRAVVLAASRGPDDPMAKAFGVAHKCALPVAGKPMLRWVLDALTAANINQPIVISIDTPSVAQALSKKGERLDIQLSKASAPASALAAIDHVGTFPILLTTGDHPLLTPDMINTFCNAALASISDVCVGLATDKTILAQYPDNKRTFFNLGGTRVSGCNLFAIKNANGLKLLQRWQHLEQNRKKPWKLVFAFGLRPLLYFAIGKLTPDRAFAMASKRLGTVVRPIFLSFAEAAIDVDKPSDHKQAETILKRRSNPV
jgi:GTP:adenosylcobinamide-phosphate guanylyltransferase